MKKITNLILIVTLIFQSGLSWGASVDEGGRYGGASYHASQNWAAQPWMQYKPNIQPYLWTSRLNLNLETLKLPEFTWPDLETQVWTFHPQSFDLDSDKTLQQFKAHVNVQQGEFNIPLSYELLNITPTQFTQIVKDSQNNTFTIDRTDQSSIPNPSYQTMRDYQQKNPKNTAVTLPREQLFTQLREKWTTQSANEKAVSIDMAVENIQYESNLHQYITQYQGSRTHNDEKVDFSVEATRPLDGRIEGLSVKLDAPGTPVVKINWNPTNTSQSSWADFQKNVPVPLLMGPRSEVTINQVDVPLQTVTVNDQGNLHLPDKSIVASLQNLTHMGPGIEVQFSAPEKESRKPTLSDHLQTFWYKLTRQWGEVQNLRKELTDRQTQNPKEFTLSVGFKDPTYMGIKDLRKALNQLDGKPATSKNSLFDTTMNIIKTPLKIVGTALGHILDLPVIKQAWTATRLATGVISGILSGDIFEKSNQIRFSEKGPAIITINGINNSDASADDLNEMVRKFFGIEKATSIKNDTHFFVLGDLIQIAFHEYLGAIDKPALDTLHAIRQGIAEKGEVFVVAHSQGSAIFQQAISLLSHEEKQKIHYLGIGPEWIVDKYKSGLASVETSINQGDFIPSLGNEYKLLTNILFPWNLGRNETLDQTERSTSVAGWGESHKFKYYEEAIKNWAYQWRY